MGKNVLHDGVKNAKDQQNLNKKTKNPARHKTAKKISQINK